VVVSTRALELGIVVCALNMTDIAA